MGLFEFFGRNNLYDYVAPPETLLYAHLAEEFSLDSGESTANHFILTITIKRNPAVWYEEGVTTETRHKVLKTFKEIQETMKEESLNPWSDRNKIIGFQVDAIGRELTDFEKEEIIKYKQECIDLVKNHHEDKRREEIKRLENKLNKLKSE